jgi:hypothetical protein
MRIRGRLRAWAVAWLVFQAASLSALVPRECCRAHRLEHPTSKPSCHEQADAKPHCSLPSSGETGCPMHHEAANAVEPSGTDGCSMRGTCEGPVATFMGLLTNHGLLRDAFILSHHLHRTPMATDHRERLITQLASPDSPPPRA